MTKANGLRKTTAYFTTPTRGHHLGAQPLAAKRKRLSQNDRQEVASGANAKTQSNAQRRSLRLIIYFGDGGNSNTHGNERLGNAQIAGGSAKANKIQRLKMTRNNNY